MRSRTFGCVSKQLKMRMKKLMIVLLMVISVGAVAQNTNSAKPGCDKTSCGPEGTKKGEAVAITSLRTDLEGIKSRMAKTNVVFSKELLESPITKGSTDDESLLYLLQTVNAVRQELTVKLDRARLSADFVSNSPVSFSTKQQLMVALKKEVQLINEQLDQLL